MDKKNTLLLTVIAVATLLVAIVGATFAFFTAQTGEGAHADVRVNTSTSDTVDYGTFEPLIIIANQQNFGENKGSQKATASGEINLTASNMQDREEEADYCYTSTIEISTNNFAYRPLESKPEQIEDEYEGSREKDLPELLLSIKKDGQVYDGTKTIGDLQYHTLSSRKVCNNNAGGPIDEDSDCTTEAISGYDITVIGNSATHPEPEGTTAIRIPVYEEVDGEVSNLIHHIKTSDASGKATTKWEATLVFVNYNFDQEYNTNKTFSATWKFVPVDCTDGTPLSEKNKG